METSLLLGIWNSSHQPFNVKNRNKTVFGIQQPVSRTGLSFITQEDHESGEADPQSNNPPILNGYKSSPFYLMEERFKATFISAHL